MVSKIRQPDDACLLCHDNLASQKGSHIIPKFFGKGLFWGQSPRKATALFKGGKRQKVQDIIKEDYLFCPECETGFSILETYCSIRLERFNEIRYYKDFNRIKLKEFEFIECKEIDIRVFNLFIYSMIWRISISNNFGFLNFKLSEHEEEKLRQILKEFSTLSQADLFDKIDAINELPNHHHLIIRPIKKLRPPKSMLSAASYNEILHQLHLVDYLIIYNTGIDTLPEKLDQLENNRLGGLVRIGLLDKAKWESFNAKMFREAVN